MKLSWLLLALAISLPACDKGAGDADKDSASSAKPAADKASEGDTKSDAKSDAKSEEGAAPVAGGSTCEQAFVEVKALIEAFAAAPGNQAKPTVPNKEDFIKACNELPPDIQSCLRFSELMKDMKKAQECKAKIDALPEDVKARTKALMDKAKANPKK